MLRKALGIALPALLVFGPAFAGGGDDPMTEMMNCHVCKNMAVHMDELGPVMSVEFVSMDHGLAMVHEVSDAGKMPVFKASCDAMDVAGAEAAEMSTDDQKSRLCGFCQDMMGCMEAGASLDKGYTKSGCLMVLTSTDEKARAKIADFEKKWVPIMTGAGS